MTTVPLYLNDDNKAIDGNETAREIIEHVKARKQSEGITPGLAVILIGEDPASRVYVQNKSNRAEECGFLSRQYNLPVSATEEEVLRLINGLNKDDDVDGILIQLPLPDQINSHTVIQAIAPEKDVDGFHYLNAGRLMTGDTGDALLPCTPAGSLHLIKKALGSNLSGKHAVVIGRSNIVGKPMASLLLQENCTVTLIHSRTEQPENICQQADIVVAAVGIPELITDNWIKPGAVVIDVGINRMTKEDGSNRLVGDVHYPSVYPKVAAITPVPGGVGPMTISMLMQNTLDAAIRNKDQKLQRQRIENKKTNIFKG